ncbi:Uncharacterised protein [Mycobacteroides abscessus subsp. massiliense]|nr:Uncharacterised protein [Mycobacteroides abscessus subsp. massiliense]
MSLKKLAGNIIIRLPISVKFLRIKELSTWRLKIRIRIKEINGYVNSKNI